MCTRIIHLINPKTDAYNAPDLPESGVVLSARRPPRRRRVCSTRPIRVSGTFFVVTPLDCVPAAELRALEVSFACGDRDNARPTTNMEK
jgi:hypothetical protein